LAIIMGRRRIILGVLVLLVVVGVVWYLQHSAALVPQRISLLRYTNGGGVPPWFNSPNRSTIIERWLAEGTNVAVFGVTNRQNKTIHLLPIARLSSPRFTNQVSVETFMPTPSPIPSGLMIGSLAPGQGSEIHVAILPSAAPWQVELTYYADPSFMDGLRLAARSVFGGRNPGRRVLETQIFLSDSIRP
jgi:hypothetical protein